MRAPYIIVALSVMYMSPSAFAQLTWKTRQVELAAALSDTEVMAEFPFKNSGSKPITISSLSTSCDCTTVELEKKEYAPAESGSIKAKFTIGSRSGAQRKIISVKSNDRTTPTVTLIMNINIPKAWELSPKYLFWRAGEKASPKIATVKVVTPEPIKLLAATPLGKYFKSEFKEIEPGREYQIIMTPVDTDKGFSEEVEVRLDLPAERGRFRVHGQVIASPARKGPATRPGGAGN